MQNADCKMQNGDPRKTKDEKRDLGKRTKQFALRVVRLYVALPKTNESQVIGKQLLRSGTSVGAQYREGECARSAAEFSSKLGGARQELRETMYWLELLAEVELFRKNGCRIFTMKQVNCLPCLRPVLTQ